MITRHGVKIKSVWKCRKCGKIQYFYGAGYRPKHCYIRKCKGDMLRKS